MLTPRGHRSFPPFFVLLGTGYCGSVTTWSTMSNDIFTAYANLSEPAGTSRFTGVSLVSLLFPV